MPQRPQQSTHLGRPVHSGGSAGVRAFTLVELLVALTLFTLMVVVVGQNINNNLGALAQMNSGSWEERSMRAIREHVLNQQSRQAIEDGGELEVAGWPKPGDRGATTAAQPTKIRWTAEINPTSTLDLFTVSVEVQTDTSDDQVQESFVVYIYRPAWGRLEDRERMVEAKQERLEALRTARGEQRRERNPR